MVGEKRNESAGGFHRLFHMRAVAAAGNDGKLRALQARMVGARVLERHHVIVLAPEHERGTLVAREAPLELAVVEIRRVEADARAEAHRPVAAELDLERSAAVAEHSEGRG